MATNCVYRNTDSLNRVETLAATYAEGEPTLSLALKPVVTVTASGDHTSTESTFYAPLTVSGIPDGGVGLTGKQVVLAFDGTWEFLATDFTDTDPDPETITQGTAIYLEVGVGLTTESSGNTLWGYVDFPPGYDKTRGYVPVRIGA